MGIRERDLSDARAVAKHVPELGEHYRETFDRLSGRFRARGLSAEDAADLAQEAIALTLSHIRRHGLTQADPKPLINTIAKNLVVERFRSGGRELAVPIDEWILRDKQDVGEEVAKRERAKKVHAAINEIPARQRTAVLMSMEGVGPADIAERLGLKRNAVDALLHRARRQLAARLQDCRDGVWGSSAFIWLRLRTRRVTWSLGSGGSPFSAFAPAIVTLGTVFAVSLSPAMPPAEQPGSARSFRPAVSRDTNTPVPAPPIGSDLRSTIATAGTPEHDPAGPEAEIRIGRRPRAGVRTDAKNPATGAEGPIFLDISHDPEDDNGRLTPIINGSIDAFCDRTPELCEEE